MFRQMVGTAIAMTMATSVLTHHTEAGGANADLHCVSKNKKVIISGKIPGDFADFELAFQENGTSITLTNDPEKEGSDRVFIHEDFKIGVFAVAVSIGNSYDLMLYGIPHSVRKSAKTTNKRFQAILQTAPRPSRRAWNNSNDFFNRLAMTCSHKHEI